MTWSTTRGIVLLALGVSPMLPAQGVTTAAIHGRVTQADGTAIPSATVRIVNLSDGRDWLIGTQPAGAYLLEAVGVGGPYRIEVRAIGFAPQERGGISLALGQRLIADFTLLPAPVAIAPITVVVTADAGVNAGRTGPAEIISRARIDERPTSGRDFLALTTLSPQTGISPSAGTANTGGITIAGQNRLYNSFQIDGGANHDLYRGRLPGRETLPRPISLEALEEIQVLPAPFDVRHGAFAGGLVNAITRSGGNTVEGPMSGFLSDAALVGRGAAGNAVADFTSWQYGGNIAGPIVRDRAHYFVSVDMQRDAVPDPGPLLTAATSGADADRIRVSYADAVRFQTILRDGFRLDPGTLGPVNSETRSEDLFGKVTAQLGTNSHLEASHHYTHGARRGFVPRTPGFYFLSATGQRNPSTVNASRLVWTSMFGSRWSNELIMSRLRLDDACYPSATFPVVRVGPAGGGQLVSGAEGGCPVRPTNSVAQEALELTANVTGAFGQHAITLGLRGETLRFRDGWLQNASGTWAFSTLDMLEARRPTNYQRTLPGPGYTGDLDFPARQFGIYVQDRWLPTRRTILTLGLRLDRPILPRPVPTNESLHTALGIDTGRLPSGRPLLSPRLGINHELDTERRTVVRGGVGIFSGPPPYMWLANAYRDDGTREVFLSCPGLRAPDFDPVAAPTTCADGSGPVPRISVLDRDARFPQNVKLAFGVDHALPGHATATIDLLYTNALNQLYATDANLVGPLDVARGEGNRPLYGTITGTITSIARTPARRDPVGFGQVVRMAGNSGDYALSASVQLRKRFGDQIEASGFYVFTRARDRMSLVNPAARANLENTPLDGTFENRPLRTSYFEIPHRVDLTASIRLPARASVVVIYSGTSGTPFTYGIEGDANADGIPTAQFSNDIVYVPRQAQLGGDINLAEFDPTLGRFVAAADSVYATLDAFIRSEPCLRRQRGRILERNSCRNPWVGTLDARVMKVFPTRNGQSLDLSADVFNVLNLLNRRWGQSRITGADPWVRMLRIVGYDTAGERGVYQLVPPIRRRARDLESRWRTEVRVRYVF